MPRSTSRDSERGQAMVEFGLMLPMLVMILAAAGYFGFAVTTQQRLAMVARQVARGVSVESSTGSTQPSSGASVGQNLNVYVATLGGGTFLNRARQQLPGLDPGRLQASPPNWRRSPVAVSPLGAGYAALYQSAASPSGFRAGCLFYGVRLSYRLDELNWLATLMGQAGTGLTVSATCVMPGELPLRGAGGFGLFDINKTLMQQAADPLTKDIYQNIELIDPK